MRRLLAVSLALAGCAGSPVPDGPAASAGRAEVAARLMRDVRVLAADSLEGRAAGTPGAARARAYLTARLAELGLRVPDDQTGFARPFALSSGGEGVNLVGVIPGTTYPSALVLTAHYDHLGIRSGEVFHGADDNASGVAAVLEIVRALRAAPPEHTLVVALFDAEESGLQGARAFVGAPPVPLGRVLAVLNLDMVARVDGRALWLAGGAHHPYLRTLVEPALADAPLPVRFGHDRGAGSDNWTGASDHAPFHAAGVPFLYAGVEDHPDYHRATDEPDRIDGAAFAASTEAILSVLRALDAGHSTLRANR